MRVLLIANYFPPYGFVGGAEVANYHTCQGLLREGVDCHFLAVNHRLADVFDQRYALNGIPVRWVSLPSRERKPSTDVYDRRVYRIVRQELARLRPDLVHIHNVSGATLAPYAACQAVGVPVVNTLHDLWLLCPNNMLYRPGGAFCNPARQAPRCRTCFTRYDFWGDVRGRRSLFAKLTSNVQTFISPSQAYIDQHVQAGYAVERFRLIPYGLMRAETLKPANPDVREIVETAHRHRTLVFAAGGYEHKGAAILLRAMPMLLGRVDQLRLVVAGSGDETLLTQFRMLGPAVRTIGKVPFADMRALFASADLTVLPSIWYDNSPVVIYENLQVGTPVLGSAFGGIPELIREGDTGYTFPVGDAAALAERVMLHFARPSHERRRMRQRCVEEAQTRLSLEAHTGRVVAVYREALAR